MLLSPLLEQAAHRLIAFLSHCFQSRCGSKTFDKVVLLFGLLVFPSFFCPFPPLPGVDDRLVAVMDRCGHIPQSMNDFGLSGSRITCGHHGVTYDITTGEIVDDVGFVDVKPLRSGRCEVRDGDLYIETGGTD